MHSYSIVVAKSSSNSSSRRYTSSSQENVYYASLLQGAWQLSLLNLAVEVLELQVKYLYKR